MRFTRLRLNGFKSFVDPTDLAIREGLTGVVGPNGCGKSNLLEALRWVMGENRASAMRGDGMEDVIFAGAATRPARNFAEVCLSIDNGERLAPVGFNDADTLEIVRRITRDAGSAFRANTRDVRARDVQMLFADASTGAHSPALVRQGQIAELINARPKHRRRVLEEAAGISGLYQRRHEAELKLQGTEANLLRLQDIVEQMAGQLATLARQVRQAVRYREIGEELRQAEGRLLVQRWWEADQARVTAEADLLARVRQAGLLELVAGRAADVRAGRDAALPPCREEAAIAGAVLQRLLVERDALKDQAARAAAAIVALTGRNRQLALDIEREAVLNRDAVETLARLEAEQSTLAAAQEGHDARLAEATERARQAGADLSDREAASSAGAEDVARLSARHLSAQRMVAEARAMRDRSRGEVVRARASAADARAVQDRAALEFAQAEAVQSQALATADAAEAALLATETARAAAQDREATARAARSGAEGEANALGAEVAALARLVARETQAREQVLDLVQVEPGYEAALGAALADDLRAPAVAAGSGSGWVTLGDYDAVPALPAGVEPLAGHVGVPQVLVRRIGQIGLVAAGQGATLQAALRPGQRLVSLEGDLWRWDGFRAMAEDAPSATALRLRQLNRLSGLRRDLEEVAARAEGARQAHEVLTARLADLARADQMAREARRDADRRVTEATRVVNRAEADQSLAGGRLEAATLAELRHGDEAEVASERLAEAEAAVQALPDLATARAAAEAVRQSVEAARLAMLAQRAAQDDLRREGEARLKRGQDAAREAASWRGRLDTAAQRSRDLVDRQAAALAELRVAEAVPAAVDGRQAAMAQAIATAEDRRRAAEDALAATETALRTAMAQEREAERAASEAREARARAHAHAEAAVAASVAAADRIGEATGAGPQDLARSLGLEAGSVGDLELIETDVARLKRQREALGAVNLRADEDARDLQAEHDALVREKSDLDEAVRKLRAGIAALNREGRERLLTAFEQVNANFTLLFTHLFGGGEARLVLVESDDPLEAGLEILCQPPGKKLSTLSLLSGGEQTLTALALIFGVFLANPAPICVLDEVDAPLDDANVARFCDLLDEMTRRTETRFLVITHHGVTMARMDRLYGVTMAEPGVSQLVSVDLKKAAALVA